MLYLLVRFKLTGEFDDGNCPDFTDNSSWYDIKLLVTHGARRTGVADSKESRSTPMTSTPYYKEMREILREKGITSNHYLHLGRILGAAALQYIELSDDDIQQLGNWIATIRDMAYSTKLPLKAMRAAAGFTDCEGMYYSPRTTIDPPEELTKFLSKVSKIYCTYLNYHLLIELKWQICRLPGLEVEEQVRILL